MTVLVGGRFARFAKTPVRNLIDGKAKRSASYASELADESLERIFKLARGKGPLAKKARGYPKTLVLV